LTSGAAVEKVWKKRKRKLKKKREVNITIIIK